MAKVTYVLMRNKKEIGVFKSYEQARSVARQHIRREFAGKHDVYADKVAKKVGRSPMWGAVSRNPTNITALGFRIVRK